MSAVNESIIDVNLNTGNIHRSFGMNLLAEGDENANIFGVRLNKDGDAVDLTGCVCTGYFIRADGNTVLINGVVSGGAAYVILPESCYTVPGAFTLAVKVTGGGVRHVVRIVDGCVADVVVGGIVDPGRIIPSVDDVMAKIAELESAIESVEDAIESAEAAEEAIENVGVLAVLISGDEYRIEYNTQ